MKKVLAFLVICLFALGAIGGFGYSVYGGSWPIAVGVVILAILAFPTVKKYWKELSN